MVEVIALLYQEICHAKVCYKSVPLCIYVPAHTYLCRYVLVHTKVSGDVPTVRLSALVVMEL